MMEYAPGRSEWPNLMTLAQVSPQKAVLLVSNKSQKL